MTSLHFPWLAAVVLLPLLGAIWVRRLRNPDTARAHSVLVAGLTLAVAIGAWVDFAIHEGAAAHDPGAAFGQAWFVVDSLSASLLPLAALLYVLTLLATLGSKVRHLPFASSLLSESILLATLCTRQPWLIIALLALSIVPVWLELRARRKPTRVFTFHMALFVGLLALGQLLLGFDGESIVGMALLMAAVLVRSGIVPVHCWMTDLFEHASFGTALLFVTPMVGVYAALRLVLPTAPDWALHGIAILSLVTALYAACMALVQREARRFFCYLFLSHASLVFVGLETTTAVGLTGALCVWMAVSLSMAGFGLVLRSVETRTGRLSLDEYHGLYSKTPLLAALFLTTGLASIGFPGTVGFIGAELLIEGAVQLYPLVGVAIVIAATLNGLAVLHAYFRVFTGTHHPGSIDLQCRPPERFAVLVLSFLIVGGGLYPQPGVSSRYRVARELVEQRQATFAAQDRARAGEISMQPKALSPAPLQH
jgi:NADH-quinone oxidoreductase subunit M